MSPRSVIYVNITDFEQGFDALIDKCKYFDIALMQQGKVTHYMISADRFQRTIALLSTNGECKARLIERGFTIEKNIKLGAAKGLLSKCQAQADISDEESRDGSIDSNATTPNESE